MEIHLCFYTNKKVIISRHLSLFGKQKLVKNTEFDISLTIKFIQNLFLRSIMRKLGHFDQKRFKFDNFYPIFIVKLT